MSGYDEERLGDLLQALPPAPEGWVGAARELPRARAQMDELAARAEADASFRARVVADLEAALRDAGVEPRAAFIESLRRRLAQ
jgi:hypothetical protein